MFENSMPTLSFDGRSLRNAHEYPHKIRN